MFALVTPLVFSLPLISTTPIFPTSLKNGLFAGSEKDFILEEVDLEELQKQLGIDLGEIY